MATQMQLVPNQSVTMNGTQNAIEFRKVIGTGVIFYSRTRGKISYNNPRSDRRNVSHGTPFVLPKDAVLEVGDQRLRVISLANGQVEVKLSTQEED